MEPSKEKLVSVTGLSKQYALGEQTVKALIDVSLDLYTGGVNALLGPSGSGKSTLLNLIGTLDSPSAGDLKFLDTDLMSLKQDEKASFRNKKLGFIFQNFNLVPVLTTIENVLLPYEMGEVQMTAKEAKNRAVSLLTKVGLKDQINQSVNKLSGGQMQRVAIARALINRPILILADEPTANLDGETTKEVMEVLRAQCEEEGSTALIATHDLTTLDYVDRIIKMSDGKIVSDTLQKGRKAS